MKKDSLPKTNTPISNFIEPIIPPEWYNTQTANTEKFYTTSYTEGNTSAPAISSTSLVNRTYTKSTNTIFYS